MAVTEPTQEQRDAYAAGRAAFDAGQPITACPHKMVSVDEDPLQLGKLWVRGFVQAREVSGTPRELPDDVQLDEEAS